ncbi:MAG: hypothetical protein HY816_16885 [Candidatus Wallbacteria bacterium]|nr:hypothetical protein [Candidatus Wallbacteria bacterium]
MSPSRSPRRWLVPSRWGFSLIEVVLVAVLVASLVALSLGSVERMPAGAALMAQADRLIQAVHDQRWRALAQRRFHRIELSPDTHSYRLLADSTSGLQVYATIELPAGVALAQTSFSADRIDIVTGGFLPAGGSVTLEAAGIRRVVEIARGSGIVSVR